MAKINSVVNRPSSSTLTKIYDGNLMLEMQDVYLDHPSRRIRPGGSRRALVHGHNDNLVLNYNGDYPGGVLIQGDTAVGKLRVESNLGIEIFNLNAPGINGVTITNTNRGIGISVADVGLDISHTSRIGLSINSNPGGVALVIYPVDAPTANRAPERAAAGSLVVVTPAELLFCVKAEVEADITNGTPFEPAVFKRVQLEDYP